MRAVVTGGAGFIGSHLCDALLAKGYEVVCVDNFVTGIRENIAHLENNDSFTFIEHDVSKHLSIDGDVDEIFHLASPASPVDYLKLPIQTLKVGSLGTHNMLGMAKSKNAKFLLASTSEVYGDPLEHPQKESYWGNVNPIGVRGVYDEAKRFAEAITMAYHRYHKIDTRIVRIFNTYGPRMRSGDGRVVPAFISQIMQQKPITVFGDGSQTRSFCYVSDMVEGLLMVMASDKHMPVNLGNPEEYTILQFADVIIKLTSSSSEITNQPLPEDDPKQRRPDITKAQELGWNPSVSLNDGLQKTIEWFKEQ